MAEERILVGIQREESHRRLEQKELIMYSTQHWCCLCGVEMNATSDGWICPICGAKTYLSNWIEWNKRS